LTEQDQLRLAGVHPDLIAKVNKVLSAMHALGFPMAVTDGVRTQQQQQKLYARGRTEPGPIVTYADGVMKKSNHQVKGDGLGRAVDCAFVVGGTFSWDARLPWKAYGACVEALGLRWGGSFTTLHDLPHMEMV
jgi:peptidoglycan L-alanyl-D-glutamate endopeptidase CwlK